MSARWMGGYVSDIAYTLGFYRELSPAFLNYVCESNGVKGPPEGRRLRYCELGCGRGYGTALLAAANADMDVVGIDFNPTHIAEARAFAEKVGLANLSFVEASFGDAVTSGDPGLDDFDFVTLHGVFTWVSPEARRDIVAFLRTRLRPGGIAYVSYNTYPGWAAVAPLQHMIRQVAARSTGDSAARVAQARDMILRLAQPNCAYTAQNPTARNRLDIIAKQDVNYLAHEFLNDFWSPIYVTDAFAQFREAKLTYVGSAAIGENRLSLAVPKDMHELVNSATDLDMREQIKDFVANKQFRRDVYVKGPIALTPAEQWQSFARSRFALTAVAATEKESWKVPAGEARPRPGLVDAVVSLLSEGTATGQEIIERAGAEGFAASDVPIVIELMVENGAALPCRRDGGAQDQSAARRLNAAVCAMAGATDTHRFLAAPVAGSAIATAQFDRLALPALLANPDAPSADIAARVIGQTESTGHKIRRNGRALGAADAGELGELIEKLRAGPVPLWRRLGVAV
ncbi:methyltransferase regulatory domain-containing protein [Ancylobacter sp. IITR112]|uniref:methyltransferase regulatory domain-containing protein n=1 Tax=Ancylobacter sp. IITR112 TaxID=3138073 RepID=UPI00352B1F63